MTDDRDENIRKLQQAIVSFLDLNEGVRLMEIAESLRTSHVWARSVLLDLQKDGVVEKTGLVYRLM